MPAPPSSTATRAACLTERQDTQDTVDRVPPEGGDERMAEDERARALALLEAAHKFPVAYEVSVITMTADETFLAVRAAAEEGLDAPLGPDDHQMVPSKGGKY